MSDPIETRVGEALREREATVATAESCTGGLICSLLTDVPGSSDYLDRGFVTYAYDAKREMLGVSREALDDHGAVSDPVAREMARGARDVADVTWGLATTGVAGPTGGSEENPVGTVYIGVAHAAPWGSGDSYASVSRYEFDGSRTEIKGEIARQALTELYEAVV
ncbi:CinA family protein [Halalkalicoccus jeotgali]|uniref:CinA domain protein n=1 Tax=Halalkalicoccus jeotgali (strain DSM 18796 / CECT 7217 / JCM 14584 / KCTC 4019 / B3) TaxID=795797 RepID=D8J6V0_HALJB|nr:CinA family protein [Halalkalicoccus jeotgali]ADJ15903.1 CinA domain protein [Halalkalicoccus jeotgali B3]ELY37999.1 CinA domain-containing protein [Halalkalicoccus jeotgali B3]